VPPLRAVTSPHPTGEWEAGAYTRAHLCSTRAVFVTDTSKAPHHMGQKVLTLS